MGGGSERHQSPVTGQWAVSGQWCVQSDVRLRMDKWQGKVAVVTGASSGIGAAIATSLAQTGVVVVALARRQDRLKSLAEELAKNGASGKLLPLEVDMRREEDILTAFSWVEKELGGADILVNNAGVFRTNLITDGITEDWRNMWEVNVLGVAICSREYLKSMEKRNNKTGHIVIISSVAAHQAVYPALNMYTATKHAVKALAMSLRKELIEKGSTIKVTCVSPGPVATEIFANSEFSESSKSIPIMEAEDVAKVVIDALSASTVTQICDVIMTPIPTTVGPY